jgi:CheY-like chemotaxis protein
MKEDCERLVRTVNDILDLSRIETKRLVLHRAPVSFARFATHCVDSLRLQSEAKGLTVTLQCQTCGFASCDPGKMERVITNILNNAIKFTPQGGGIVVESHRLGPESPSTGPHPAAGADRVSAAGAPPFDGMIEFSVSDNGIGIPREHLPHITERFYRVEEQVSGTGLGLTLCKEMIEAHGGELRIESPPPGQEKGTRVSFRIPALPPPKVLVADDDAIIQNVLAAQLQQVGYEVVRCGSGTEVLQLIAKFVPDALVIDLLMPGMDGTEAIVKIKAENAWRKVPIVAITGGGIASEKRQVLECFGVPALQKPWHPETLLRTLEEVTYGRAYLRGGA